MDTQTVTKKALLFDSTLCIGCGACYSACKERNKLPQTAADFLRDNLSADTFTVVNRRNNRYVRRMCMHCNEPTCVSVCPVGALVKSAEGPVWYEESKCMGCRYCVQACPFGNAVYDSLTNSIIKCDTCAGEPACAAACPVAAIVYVDETASTSSCQKAFAKKFQIGGLSRDKLYPLVKSENSRII